jgi:hypothetical protein
MMIGMQPLLFTASMCATPRFLLMTIAVAGAALAGFAQSADAQSGPRPHFPRVEVTDIGPERGSFLSLAADTRDSIRRTRPRYTQPERVDSSRSTFGTTRDCRFGDIEINFSDGIEELED